MSACWYFYIIFVISIPDWSTVNRSSLTCFLDRLGLLGNETVTFNVEYQDVISRHSFIKQSLHKVSRFSYAVLRFDAHANICEKSGLFNT